MPYLLHFPFKRYICRRRYPSSVHLLLQVNHRRVSRAALSAHVVLAPWALDHRRDSPGDSEQFVFHDSVWFGHALVQLGWHVVVELAIAALHEHLRNGCHTSLRRRHGGTD